MRRLWPLLALAKAQHSDHQALRAALRQARSSRPAWTRKKAVYVQVDTRARGRAGSPTPAEGPVAGAVVDEDA